MYRIYYVFRGIIRAILDTSMYNTIYTFGEMVKFWWYIQVLNPPPGADEHQWLKQMSLFKTPESDTWILKTPRRQCVAMMGCREGVINCVFGGAVIVIRFAPQSLWIRTILFSVCVYTFTYGRINTFKLRLSHDHYYNYCCPDSGVIYTSTINDTTIFKNK